MTLAAFSYDKYSPNSTTDRQATIRSFEVQGQETTWWVVCVSWLTQVSSNVATLKRYISSLGKKRYLFEVRFAGSSSFGEPDPRRYLFICIFLAHTVLGWPKTSINPFLNHQIPWRTGPNPAAPYIHLTLSPSIPCLSEVRRVIDK